MTRLRVRDLGPGMHPSEKVVEIKTKDSTEELIVDKSLVEENAIAVSPLAASNGHEFVELPRETMRGLWRVWVNRDDLIKAGV